MKGITQMVPYKNAEFSDSNMNSQMMNYRQQEKPTSQLLPAQMLPSYQSPVSRSLPTQQTVPVHMQSMQSGLLTQGQQGMTPQMTTQSMSPPAVTPTTLETPYYTAGLLRTFIGQRMRVQFLIGTNGPLLDITGTLLEVGATYIILQPVDTDDITVCDLYSIKFVTVFR
jgi:hypothetical protein